MPRQRKPTALLELNGTFEHEPGRARPNEPRDYRPLGEPPERLPPDALPFWEEIVSMCVSGGLSFRDRWAVETLSRLMWKMVRKPNVEALLELVRLGELDSNQVKALVDEEKICGAELTLFRSLLGSLGLTPADRAKLSVDPEALKPKNKFAALAAEASRIRPN